MKGDGVRFADGTATSCTLRVAAASAHAPVVMTMHAVSANQCKKKADAEGAKPIIQCVSST